MGRNYSQLDLDERIELNCLRDAGCSRREIGRLMGRSHTTICRELSHLELGALIVESAVLPTMDQPWLIADVRIWVSGTDVADQM